MGSGASTCPAPATVGVGTPSTEDKLSKANTFVDPAKVNVEESTCPVPATVGVITPNKEEKTTTSNTFVDPANVNAEEPPADNLVWIVSSLKPILPYLTVEAVLCLHHVNKLLVWHIHNLHIWRLMCFRDFPNARSQLHDRLILRDPHAASTKIHPDADAKAVYFELFCQRFVMEAEIRMHSHCTGSIVQQLRELTRHGSTPIPITFKATIGRMPDTIPVFPALAPTETSSLALEWIPRPGVALTDATMDLLRRAFVFMAYHLTSDPKDGPIQPGSRTKGDVPRVSE